MHLTAEAIIALVGVIVALPPVIFLAMSYARGGSGTRPDAASVDVEQVFPVPMLNGVIPDPRLAQLTLQPSPAESSSTRQTAETIESPFRAATF